MTDSFNIRLAAPMITQDQEEAVLSVLRSGQLVAGPRVREFESHLAHLTGRRYAVAVSSGTAALVVVMQAMGIGKGSVVVVPGFTFPAPAMAAASLGATVRLCDVDPKTLNLSVDTLRPVLDSSVSLVVAIDQFGMPAPVPDIEAICAPFRIPVLVDAACSLGSTLGGIPCGGFGAAAIFSFHPRKIVTTAEGGAILTDDEQIFTTVRRFRNIGMEDGGFASMGLNYRPSEMGAAMGIIQLEGLDATVRHRRRLKDVYGSLPLSLQEGPPLSVENVQTLAAMVPASRGLKGRDDLRAYLAKHGVESQVASYCLGSIGPLCERFGFVASDTPSALMAHHCGIALPVHGRMTEADARQVVSIIEDWLSTTGRTG